MYKGLQYLHVSRKNATGSVSLLALADQFARYHVDTIEQKPVKTWDAGVYSRFTASLYAQQTWQKLSLTGNVAYQGGKYADGGKVDGWLLSAQALYAVSSKIKAGLGADYTTGGKSGATSRAFDPLYGTPHKFWGHMDYYYAGSTFGVQGSRITISDCSSGPVQNGVSRQTVTGSFPPATSLRKAAVLDGRRM